MFAKFTLIALICLSPLASIANWSFRGGAQASYNPAMSANYGYMQAPNPNASYWGGGYNLNSMMGNGGWGGFPAGYGFNTMQAAPVQIGAPSSSVPALTGGFGGFYSPFIGGF